jgi:UDP-2,3-diacylglucosamine pyrophosphatase LpxH
MATITKLPFIADIANIADSALSIPERQITERRSFRTVWISDVHLGTRGCNAAMLIDFLDHVDSETMYLVGDIIDGWRLKKKFYWPAAHNDIVWRILKRAKRGTRVVYIPGNHDEVTLSHRWLAHLGDAAYEFIMALNRFVNAWRRWCNLPYWSLSKHAKKKVKNAVEFISQFEEVVAHEAKLRGVDGVIAGHIHTAEIRVIEGVEYYNDGDWVEGCTALVEHFDGRMEILHWADEMTARANADAPATLAA